jgi:hypothetical protein
VRGEGGKPPASYLEAGGEGGGDGAAEQGPRDAALAGHPSTSSPLGLGAPERGDSFQSVVEGGAEGGGAGGDSDAGYIGGGVVGAESPRVDLTQRRSNGTAWRLRTPRCPPRPVRLVR